MGAEAAEKAVAEAIAADAGVALARIDAMLDRGDRRHRLQRRPGRIEAARRLVDQRLVIVGAQPRIFAGADAVGKAVRVEARHRHKGEDVAVVRTEEHTSELHYLMR